jgi:hypothetical protein
VKRSVEEDEDRNESSRCAARGLHLLDKGGSPCSLS